MSFRGGPFLIPVQSSTRLLSERSSVTSKLPLRGLDGFTCTGSSGASSCRAWLKAAAWRPYTRQLVQCSMTTVAPSASFSRLSTVSIGAAPALRFLPWGAMARISGMARWWNKGRCNSGETNQQPGITDAKFKSRSKGKCAGVGRRTRDLKAGPSSPTTLSKGSRRGNPDQTNIVQH